MTFCYCFLSSPFYNTDYIASGNTYLIGASSHILFEVCNYSSIRAFKTVKSVHTHTLFTHPLQVGNSEVFGGGVEEEKEMAN